MALTKKDLQKIEKLFDKNFELRFADIFQRFTNVFATKKEVREIVKEELVPVKKDIHKLKDDVSGIRNELDTEHELRYKYIENNTRRIDKLELAIK